MTTNNNGDSTSPAPGQRSKKKKRFPDEPWDMPVWVF